MTEPTLDISSDELNHITRLLYLRTGMVFGEQRRFHIERRISELMQRLGLNSVAAYLNALVSRPSEMENFVNAFTNNETYFYREEKQFATLADDVLPLVVAGRRPGDLVRIWSLPCSTGEEPYSIAIWLLENWPMVDSWHIEIVGSDIDTKVLAQAKAGRFGARSLSRLPDTILDAYFEPELQHQREIIDDLKESVLFTQVNLIDSNSVAMEKPFDVVFCRNLLIYFDEESRRIAAANLYNRLNPGGFLFLGHTEAMSRIDERFEMVRFGDAIAYRRP